MLTAILLGALAVVALVAIIYIVVITAKWLKNIIVERVKARRNHKVVFADTREAVDEYIKENVNNKDGISMSDLEKLCEETPYFVAEIDKDTDEISNFQSYKAGSVEEGLKKKIHAEGGIVVFE